MIFDIVVIVAAILVGGLLLFPVKVRFLFRGSRNEGKLEVLLFRKKVFSTEEEKTAADASSVNSEDSSATAGGKQPAENTVTDEEKASEEDNFDAENPWQNADSETTQAAATELETVIGAKVPAEKKKEVVVEAKAPVEKKSEMPMSTTKAGEEKKNAPEVKSKKSKKRKTKKSKQKTEASDVEFLTLVAEPHFDKKLLKHSLHIGKAFFRIFHCYFEKTVVEGIRWYDDYEQMGYLMGGLNFMSGTIPLFNNWEFLVDWQGGKPLSIRGGFVAQFSIARVLGFMLVISSAAAQLVALYFWNRRKYRKNPESIRLVFWRRWIVRFLAAK